ncbi:MAG TPA: lyase family protein, partial [Steroidobacteraceae bacterium]
MTRLWDKGIALDSQVLAFTAGDDHLLDNRLVSYDIRASIAHAEMLAVQGLLSAPDLESIRDALTAIGSEHAQGQWRIVLEQEDCQTAIENLLTARVGAAGGRLHAGRSRNDQVLAALRLYMRDAATELHQGAAAVASALDALAARHGAVVLPGYTHMQQAMPSSVALWAQGFAAEIRDDAEGLALTQRRIGKNPLGSAAGYGTPN